MRRPNDRDEMLAITQGAAFALAADIAMARLIPRRRTTVAALGLVAAAAAYPVSRRRLGMNTGETVTLAAACAVAITAACVPDRTARRLLGVGWAAHAVYDAMGARLILATPTQDNRPSLTQNELRGQTPGL